MHRLPLALLLGGAVLLTSYINAPAALTPAPARVSPADMAEIDAVAPLAGEVAEQAERLRARMAAAPDRPVARRDPFSFGARRDSPTPPDTAAAQPAELADATAPPITWPVLVALLTDRGEPDTRTAVLAINDDVEMLHVGDTTAGFVVREITATSVEIIHTATSTVTRLSIR